MRLLEGPLELLQLRRGERRPYPPLLSFLGEHAVMAGVDLVRQSTCKRRHLAAVSRSKVPSAIPLLQQQEEETTPDIDRSGSLGLRYEKSALAEGRMRPREFEDGRKGFAISLSVIRDGGVF